MVKKHLWIIELWVVMTFFAVTLQIILWIGSNCFTDFFIGFLLNIFIYCLFLLYAIKKNEYNSIKTMFSKKLYLKDLILILIIVVFMKISYNLIFRISSLNFLVIKGISTIPVSKNQSWLLVSLLFLFISVIVISEELFFRGYLFSVQLKSFDKLTWIINGCSWSIYHLFTPTNFIAFLPGSFLLAYIYQIRRNIWITIIAHFLLNLNSFYPLMKTFIYK